jgi:hypothetical protein
MKDMLNMWKNNGLNAEFREFDEELDMPVTKMGMIAI